VASTIFAAPLIRDAAKEPIPHIWWLQEGLVGNHYLNKYSVLPGVLGLAGLIITPDKSSRRIYQPFARRPIRVLPYGIPDVVHGRIGRRRRPDEPLRFLLLGTIEHRKGQQTLLEAVRRLPQDVLDRSEFLIVGRPNDTKLAAEVRSAAEGSSHIRFRETVAHNDALALIQETDVMLCTSSDETGPLTLIEAMALGKAILSTKVGLVGEYLIPEEDALFVEPGDAVALAAAIERLVRQRKLITKLAINARNAYDRYFDIDRFGKGFLEVLEEAIVAGKRRETSDDDLVTYARSYEPASPAE